jgi:predicted deacylase
MAEASYAVEIEAPDITPYRAGNTGIDYVTTFESGRPGPHVMIAAVVHGNELCGAITLDFLFKNGVRPRCGTLTLGFMNVAAFDSFDAGRPETSRLVDEDFNRVWDAEVLGGPRDSVELRRAREVRPVIDGVDYLLDIHSMQNTNVPLMMCGPLAKGRRFAREIGFPAHVISDSGHAAGRRMRDYGPFADEADPRNALLVECGQHWEKSSVEVARETAVRFLAHFDMLEADFVSRFLPAEPPPPQAVVLVTDPITISADQFRFTDEFVGMEVIEKAGTVIGWDGDEEVRTPHDRCVLIMPSRRLTKGITAVRLGRFVSD